MPDLFDLQECKDIFKEAETQFSRRKALFDRMENMFFLVDNDLPNKSWIRKVKNPDPRNYILGAVRLLTATEPKWRVPRTTNADELSNMADDLENVCEAINYISGQTTGRPVEVEAALSAMIYGEVHLKVINTKAVLEAQKSGPKQTRAAYTNMRTPLILQCVNPKIGYPLYDYNGLSAYASMEKVTTDYIRSRFGDDKLAGRKRTDKVNFFELWADNTHACWCDGEDKELLLDKNELGFIPMFCEIVEGSDFFVEESQSSRQPLMFGYSESGMWQADNMALTIMSSLALSVVGSPMMKFKQANVGDMYSIERSDVPWGVAVLPPGSEFDALMKQVIDPSIPRIHELAEQKGMESSIYKQTLGQPLGNNAAFSMLSLANAGGRLPIVPYQRCIAHVFANAMYNGLQMLRMGGLGQKTLQGPQGPISFDFRNTPENFILECDLDISVPTDDRENVALAVQATQGESPLVSMEYARQKWMKIGQSKKMQEDIWTEQRLSLKNTIDLKAQASAMEAQAKQAATGGGTTPLEQAQSIPEVGPGGERGLAQVSPKTLGKNQAGLV